MNTMNASPAKNPSFDEWMKRQPGVRFDLSKLTHTTYSPTRKGASMKRLSPGDLSHGMNEWFVLAVWAAIVLVVLSAAVGLVALAVTVAP